MKNRTKNTTNFQVWDPILEPFGLGFPGGDCLLTTKFSEPLQENPSSDFCLPRGTVGAIRQHPGSDFAFPLGPVGAIRRPFQVRACRSHLRFFFLPSNTTSPTPHQHITRHVVADCPRRFSYLDVSYRCARRFRAAQRCALRMFLSRYDAASCYFAMVSCATSHKRKMST